MATRGLYIFKDNDETLAVYCHWDNYPKGALLRIQNTLDSDKTWLKTSYNRFEPNEFGAGFVAVNKNEAGGVRLCNYRGEVDWEEYNYTIYFKNDQLCVNCFTRSDVLFEGTFEQFKTWVENYKD